MKIRPLYDRIIVKRVEAETTTKSGLIIPDTAKEKPIEGEVVAVGNGKVGDKILFGKYSGTEVKVEDTEHLIIREEDILGIIER